MVEDEHNQLEADGGTTFDETEFRPTHGTVPSEVDVADDEHPLKQALGDEAHRAIEADERVVGERFAFRYQEPRAFVREYLANAETGCIRRARLELTEHNPDTYDTEWFDNHTVPELLDEAREVVGYYPVIETHAAPPGTNKPRFRIEDNGIGISVEEFMVMKKLGLSASHNEGTQLGSFGQGVMSVFPVVGRYGDLTITTKSRLDGSNYSVRFKIDGFNDLTGTRDDYGTTFDIPAFADEVDIDVNDAIEEYTEGMYVPVLHHKYDGEGLEDSKEEYTYTPLEDLLPEGAPRVTYEDDMIEAVASPVIGNGRADVQEPKIFLVTMPIEDNTSLPTLSCGWKYHIRIKDESGAIYECTHEHTDHEGLVPVEPERYTEELIEAKEAVHTGHLGPGDLVGYGQSDGTYAVPRGIDDELVTSRDDLDVVDRDKEMGGQRVGDAYPEPIEGLSTKVVDGQHEDRWVLPKEEWDAMETGVDDQFVSQDDLNLASKRKLSDDNEYDVALPTPVDDRDRLGKHGGQTYEIVSRRLSAQFEERAQELFERFAEGGFDVWYDLEEADRGLFTKAFTQKIYPGHEVSADFIIEKGRAFDVTFDESTAEKLAIFYQNIELAPRGCDRPERKGSRNTVKVKDVLLKAGEDSDVYMGATISRDKAELAWEIDDNNQVVCVDGADRYQVYDDLFGWTPLKDLDLYDVGQYDVGADVVQRLERSSTSSSDSSGGGWSGELDAETREIEIRSDEQRVTRSTTPRDAVERLEDGGVVSKPSGSASYLLVFREPDVGGVGVGRKAAIGPIGRTVVPNYVADYFEAQDVDNIYVIEGSYYDEAVNDIRSRMRDQEFETISLDPYIEATDDGLEVNSDPDTVDRSTERLGDLGPETIVVTLPDQLLDVVSGDDEYAFVDEDQSVATICRSLCENDVIRATHERIVLTDSSSVNETALAWGATKPMYSSRGVTPKLVKHSNISSYNLEPPYDNWSPSNNTYMELILPEDVFDRSTDEWKATAGKLSYKIKKQRSQGMTMVNLLHRLAELTPEDEEVFKQ